LSLEILVANGEHFRATPMSVYVRAGDKPMLAATFGGDQILWIHKSIWERLTTGRVTITGQVTATIHRHGQPTWMPVEASEPIQQIGHCYSTLYEDRMELSGLKVVCESPSRLPLSSAIRIWDPATGKDWRLGLRASYTSPTSVYPKTTWLSPLWREQAWFQVTPRDSQHPGDRWLIPRAALDRAKIEITPVFDAGCTTLRYQLRDIALADYVLPAPR
jgi:hypothetical protein